MSSDNMNSGDYAPKSPDLSSFLSTGPTQAPQALGHSSHAQAAHAPPPPFSLDNHQAYQAHHHQLHHQPRNFQPSYLPYQAPYPAPPAAGYHHPSYNPPVHTEYATGPPPKQAPNPYLSPPAHQPHFDINAQYATGHTYQPPPASYPQVKTEPPREYSQFDPSAYPTSQGQYTPAASVKEEFKPEVAMPPKKVAADIAVDEKPSSFLEPSPVKTKFPTARIKRIMQADEEVGKVAQQTPIAVGKALELFMVQLVSKSADIAKEKGSKRVTASMLKQVVETDEQWDFLRDIVGKVENEKENGKVKAKQESESEEEEVSEPKKRTRGRKKKNAQG